MALLSGELKLARSLLSAMTGIDAPRGEIAEKQKSHACWHGMEMGFGFFINLIIAVKALGRGGRLCRIFKCHNAIASDRSCYAYGGFGGLADRDRGDRAIG